jgi:hypothetical protein
MQRSKFEIREVFSVLVLTESEFDWNPKFTAINAYLAEHTGIRCEFELQQFDTSKTKTRDKLVDWDWYQRAVTDRYPGYDLITLHIGTKVWANAGGDKRYNGYYIADGDGISEIYIIADEKQTLTRGKKWDRFTHTFLHELAHALYAKTGVPLKFPPGDLDYIPGMDNTHHFDHGKKDLDLVWDDIPYLKDTKTWLQTMVDKIKSAAKPNPTISQFAEAIKLYEGWHAPGAPGYPKGSVSYRNKNPGNLRYSPFESSNVNNFSVFKTYEDGWKALIHQVRIAVTGKSKVYKPSDSILQFFDKYAPSSDNNYPVNYAKYVASKIGVTTSFQLGNLRDL